MVRRQHLRLLSRASDRRLGGRAGDVGEGLVFTPDSRLLAVADPSGSIRLMEPATGRLVAALEDPNANRAMSAVITPDGSRLIFGSGDSLSVHVWDLRPSAASSPKWNWTGTGRGSRGPSPRRCRKGRSNWSSTSAN